MKKFAVLGSPIDHSLSPEMHTANFRFLGIDATYGKFDIAPGALSDALNNLKQKGYSGVNITMPLKKEAVKSLDKFNEDVLLSNACNTIFFDDEIIGFNTDVEAAKLILSGKTDFSLGFEEAKSILILGGGGAATALLFAALRCATFTRVSVAIRSKKRREELLHIYNQVREKNKKEKNETPALNIIVYSDISELSSFVKESQLIVNATPLGLKSDDLPPIQLDAISAKHKILDLIPSRKETPLIARARECGAKSVDGIKFLVLQGALSFEKWFSKKANFEVMEKSLR